MTEGSDRENRMGHNKYKKKHAKAAQPDQGALDQLYALVRCLCVVLHIDGIINTKSLHCWPLA